MKGKLHILAFVAFLMLFGVFLLALPRAYAVEVEGGSDDEVPANVDYTELLESIDSKLDDIAKTEDVEAIEDGMADLAKADDVAAVKRAVEGVQPVDNSERVEALNELFSGMTSINVFQWVTLMLLLGVLCALVFLVAYRSHT